MIARIDARVAKRARGLPGLSQLDFAVDLVGEADAAERHRRAGGEGPIAVGPALRKGVADRLFDLALGGHAERLEKLPNAGVEDVFVHGHLLCTCPSGHDPRLSCPSLPCGVAPRPPSPALARLALAGGRSPLLALRSRPTIQIVASACRRCRRCPRRTEFVSRRDLRYLLRQARFGHNLANALDEGCGTERLLPQDHLNSGIQPRMILDRKVACSDDNNRDLVPDRMLLHLCYELESVHLWHHQIENDD